MNQGGLTMMTGWRDQHAFLLDEEESVLEANPAAHALLGLAPHELVGQRFTDLLASERLEVNRYFLDQLERTGAANAASSSGVVLGTPCVRRSATGRNGFRVGGRGQLRSSRPSTQRWEKSRPVVSR